MVMIDDSETGNLNKKAAEVIDGLIKDGLDISDIGYISNKITYYALLGGESKSIKKAEIMLNIIKTTLLLSLRAEGFK